MAGLVTNPAGAMLTKVEADALIEVTENRTYIETRYQLAGVIGGNIPDPPKPPDPFHIIIDHPFLFMILDEETDSIHYIGVVTHPTEVSAMQDLGMD
jgi:serine protease inhibitor